MAIFDRPAAEYIINQDLDQLETYNGSNIKKYL